MASGVTHTSIDAYCSLRTAMGRKKAIVAARKEKVHQDEDWDNVSTGRCTVDFYI
jgi:hypothetical protein